MDLIEKIRDITVSIHPGRQEKVDGKYKRLGNVHKLLIPIKIVNELKLERGRPCTLIISPPLDSIKNGSNFKLIYEFGEYKKVDKKWKEINPDDYKEEFNIENIVNGNGTK